MRGNKLQNFGNIIIVETFSSNFLRYISYPLDNLIDTVNLTETSSFETISGNNFDQAEFNVDSLISF